MSGRAGVTCPRCGGSGEHPQQPDEYGGPLRVRFMRCHVCQGTGIATWGPRPGAARGAGWVPRAGGTFAIAPDETPRA